MVGVAYFLIEDAPTGGWGNFEDMQRAAQPVGAGTCDRP